jgi:hypothetical protein
MDGTLVYSFTDTGITGSNVTYPGGFSSCDGMVATQNLQTGSDFANDHWNYLTSYQYYDSAGRLLEISQTVESVRHAGAVTYFSYGYQCYYLSSPSTTCDNPTDYYVWNNAGQSVNGAFVALGSTWVPSIVAQDAVGNTFAGSISVPLTTTQQTNVQPNTCVTQGPDSNGYSAQSCSSYNYNYTITEGFASN